MYSEDVRAIMFGIAIGLAIGLLMPGCAGKPQVQDFEQVKTCLKGGRVNVGPYAMGPKARGACD